MLRNSSIYWTNLEHLFDTTSERPLKSAHNEMHGITLIVETRFATTYLLNLFTLFFYSNHLTWFDSQFDNNIFYTRWCSKYFTSSAPSASSTKWHFLSIVSLIFIKHKYTHVDIASECIRFICIIRLLLILWFAWDKRKSYFEIYVLNVANASVYFYMDFLAE